MRNLRGRESFMAYFVLRQKRFQKGLVGNQEIAFGIPHRRNHTHVIKNSNVNSRKLKVDQYRLGIIRYYIFKYVIPVYSRPRQMQEFVQLRYYCCLKYQPELVASLATFVLHTTDCIGYFQ